MGTDRSDVAEPVKPVILNLGCGFTKLDWAINVDAFDICKPDVVWDLNKFPYPWESNSVDGIELWHVLEHLKDWYAAIKECCRILKVGGYIDVRVPDESSSSALAYRDHYHVFTQRTFDSVISGPQQTTNAWFTQEARLGLRMESHNLVPFAQYAWMARWAPWLMRFCAKHLRNFIWEQQFMFIKVEENNALGNKS